MADGALPLFICDKPGGDLKKKVILTAHITNASSTKMSCAKWICDLCSKQFFNTRYFLLQHILAQHENIRQFKCQLCSAAYSNQKHLRRHEDNIHKNIRFECDDCGKMVGGKSSLATHIRAVHQKLCPFQCGVCGATYNCCSTLKRHSNAKHNGIKFECDQCGAKVVDKDVLCVHIHALHMKPLQIKCDQCPAAFNRHSDMLNHKQSVHKNNSFTCDVCSMAINSHCGIMSHIAAVHLKLCPLKCEQCPAVFSRQKYLNRHKRNIHDVSKRTFMCDLCSKVLCDKGRLTTHCFAVHMELYRFKCSVCEQTFKCRETLSNHTKLHCWRQDE